MTARIYATDSPAADGDTAALTDEAQMLVLLRDELYEGSWDEFVQDLRDRLKGRPHVFDIAPPSPRLRETIRHHLDLIEAMRYLEAREQVNLADHIPSDNRLSSG